jgi:hypothetical protein
MVSTNSRATLNHAKDLGRFRFHTGGQPLRLEPDQPCPPLFRDIGFEAMGRFLRGELSRLCGPLSPITYLRTAAYREPYVDHGRIGRIMLLQPEDIEPWHSGVEEVFIAPRETKINLQSMVFIPSEIPLKEAALRFRDVRVRDELVEAIGRPEYEAAVNETLASVNKLQQTHEQTEYFAGPLRRLFQSMNCGDRQRASEWMIRLGLSESDLCTAWHHLPADRRREIQVRLSELPEVLR